MWLSFFLLEPPQIRKVWIKVLIACNPKASEIRKESKGLSSNFSSLCFLLVPRVIYVHIESLIDSLLRRNMRVFHAESPSYTKSPRSRVKDAFETVKKVVTVFVNLTATCDLSTTVASLASFWDFYRTSACYVLLRILSRTESSPLPQITINLVSYTTHKEWRRAGIRSSPPPPPFFSMYIYDLPSITFKKFASANNLAIIYSSGKCKKLERTLTQEEAKYCAPEWFRSAQTRLIDNVLNDALRIVTGCLRPIPTVHLYRTVLLSI